MEIFGDVLDSFQVYRRGIRFQAKFRVRSVASLQNKEFLETGGRILMPASCVHVISEMNIETPWTFCIKNPKNELKIYCGVLEFTAEEGRIYVPTQFFNSLDLLPGQVVEVFTISLPLAKFAKFQPESSDFLKLTNPRSVLETSLRSYACLTVGQIICIGHCDKIFTLKIVSLGEGVEAARIIDCDVLFEFVQPEGYIEDTPENRQERMLEESATKVEEMVQKTISDGSNQSESKVFRGEPVRIDGKKRMSTSPVGVPKQERKVGIPDYNFEIGTLLYIRKGILDKTNTQDNLNAEPNPFKGEGRKLREKPK